MNKINVGTDLYLKGRIGWKGLSKDEYLEKSQFRIINGTALEGKFINWNKCGFISEERYEESQEIKLEENDILISKDGTLGKIGYVKNLNAPSTVASGIFVLRNIISDKLDTDYLYHFLKSNIFTDFINRMKASGSTILHLYQRDLAQLELDVPEIKTQKRIAQVLNSIDSKIEFNNRINSELEAMAKTLYDYWFVQFDFPFDFAQGKPDPKGKPYKTNGGKMVWNEELKREIPEGWKGYSLSQLLDCNKWTIKKENNYIFINYLETSNLSKNVIGEIQKIDCEVESLPSRAQRLVAKDDILYSTVRPNQCHFGIIKEPIENMVASTGFAQLRSKVKALSNDLVYQFLSTESTISRLQKIADSAVSSYPSILPNDILELKIVLPGNLDHLKNFTQIFESLNLKISNSLKENQQLSELRDWLLPMLMNGQVTVGDSAENKASYKIEEEMRVAAEPGGGYN